MTRRRQKRRSEHGPLHLRPGGASQLGYRPSRRRRQRRLLRTPLHYRPENAALPNATSSACALIISFCSFLWTRGSAGVGIGSTSHRTKRPLRSKTKLASRLRSEVHSRLITNSSCARGSLPPCTSSVQPA